MAESTAAAVSDNRSTPASKAEPTAPVEKYCAAWDLIAPAPTRLLVGVGLTAGVCHSIARGEVELVWPMPRSLVADLRVPLDEVTLLRCTFTELALPLPPRWPLAPATVERGQ